MLISRHRPLFLFLSIAIFALSSTARAETTNWQGFYVGANAGYGKNDLNGVWDSAGSSFPINALESGGAIAGGHIGYNYQRGIFVYGLEGTIANSWIDESADEDNVVPATSEGNTHEFDTDWFATIRGRAGFTYEKFLIYATAGVAYVESEIHVEADENNSTPDRLDINTWGGAFGAGLEYSFNENLSLRAESQYLLLDERKSLNRSSLNDADSGDFIEVDSVLLFQAGISYRF